MRSFSLSILGIQFIDTNVNTKDTLYHEQKTSIPSDITIDFGSIISLFYTYSKNLSNKNINFFPIIGEDSISFPSDEKISYISIKKEKTARSILISKPFKGKNFSYCDSSIGNNKDLEKNIINKISKIVKRNSYLHLMYADNMNIKNLLIDYLIKNKIKYSIDFSLSNASTIFETKSNLAQMQKIINNADLIFLSDQEDPRYENICKENIRKGCLLVKHSPRFVEINLENKSSILENKFHSNSYLNTVGAGDFFAIEFLYKFHQSFTSGQNWESAISAAKYSMYATKEFLDQKNNSKVYINP